MCGELWPDANFTYYPPLCFFAVALHQYLVFVRPDIGIDVLFFLVVLGFVLMDRRRAPLFAVWALWVLFLKA